MSLDHLLVFCGPAESLVPSYYLLFVCLLVCPGDIASGGTHVGTTGTKTRLHVLTSSKGQIC